MNEAKVVEHIYNFNGLTDCESKPIWERRFVSLDAQVATTVLKKKDRASHEEGLEAREQ